MSVVFITIILTALLECKPSQEEIWKGGTKSMLEISTTPSLAFFPRLNPSGNFAGVVVGKFGQSQKSMSLPEWIAKIQETLEEPNSP